MLQHLFLFVSHINALIVFLNVSSISGETISGPQSSHVREERAHEQHTHLVQSHTPTETSLSTNKSKHTPSLHSHCATPTRRAPRSVAIVHPSSSHLCARSFVGRIYIYIYIHKSGLCSQCANRNLWYTQKHTVRDHFDLRSQASSDPPQCGQVLHSTMITSTK